MSFSLAIVLMQFAIAAINLVAAICKAINYIRKAIKRIKK